jgi:signal peptidase I
MLGFLKRNVFLIVSAGIFLVAVFAVFVAGAGNDIYIFGYKPFITATGSMEPTIMTNSFAIAKQQDLSATQIDEIAVFRIDEKTLAAHRIVAINDDGTLTTKGDANSIPDFGSVGADRYVGTVSYYNNDVAGYVAKVREPGGVFLYLILPIVAVIVIIVMARYGYRLLRKALARPEAAKKSPGTPENKHSD